MMTSLFSMFDPTTKFNMQLNWTMMIIVFIIMPYPYWKSLSRSSMVMNIIINVLNKEFNALFKKMILMKGTTLIFISLFLIILINNLTSNYPYTFCCPAQLCFSLSLSIPIWSSIIVFYWLSLTKSMLSHLVPAGTPYILMPLMVIIEMISNLIRPLALAVRLTANLIAGHLLMALLGNMMNFNQKLWLLILILQAMFLFFEIMVAMIQSYVFSVLMTLYSSEMS
uniref:ATP synthase F0 subunit 6 n=1 Tax=Egeirotrioza xingi TaxID=3132083 RepID=UPI0030FED3C8